MTISGFDTPVMLLLLARTPPPAPHAPHARTMPTLALTRTCTCTAAIARTHARHHHHPALTPPPHPQPSRAGTPPREAAPSKAAGSEGFRTTQNVCRITHLHWHRPSHRCHAPQLLSDQTSPRPVVIIKIQIILYVLIVVVVNVLSQKYQSSCVI